jgi:hypothetical protein
MSRPRLRGALALFCAAALVSPACSTKSPEDRVREVIGKCQAATKDHKPGGVMEQIAKEFRDNHGNSRDMLKAILLREMMANRNLGVYITTNEVTVTGGEASAALKVIVTGSSGIIPDSADGIKVKLTLREDDGKWKITAAEWTTSFRGDL